MTTELYRYALELSKRDGTVLGQAPVAPDFEPALEWTRFEQLRRLSVAGVPDARPGLAAIKPVWDRDRGAPYLSGFRGVIQEPPGQAVSCEFPANYLAADARRASADFVEKGLLKAGDIYLYRIVALRYTRATAPVDQGSKIVVEEIDRRIPLIERDMRPRVEASVERGEQSAGDPPVFIPRRVLDEAADIARHAGEIEVGGVLVGELCRDPATGGVFVDITAQIKARQTVANKTKLTFTPETWADIDAVIALRGRNELKISWWHYHPAFCRKCPPDVRARCTFSSEFFSADDLHLHRTCFGRAFNVAFLVSDIESRGLVWSCFGWRRGMMARRGYSVVDGDRARSLRQADRHTTTARAAET